MARLSKRIVDQFTQRVSDLELFFDPDDHIEALTNFTINIFNSVPSSPQQTLSFDHAIGSDQYQELYDQLKENYRTKTMNQPRLKERRAIHGNR